MKLTIHTVKCNRRIYRNSSTNPNPNSKPNPIPAHNRCSRHCYSGDRSLVRISECLFVQFQPKMAHI